MHTHTQIKHMKSKEIISYLQCKRNYLYIYAHSYSIASSKNLKPYDFIIPKYMID